MNRHHRFATLAAGGLLLGTALSGCTTSQTPRAEVSANKAQSALEKGRTDVALSHAEAAVLAEPRNSSYRAMLATAYLDAGRFESARTAFDDALKLGDTAPRTALGYALASIGAGDNAAALAVLEDWRQEIAPADLGLALALAGDVDGGAALIAETIRQGQNSPKLRQNLAYAYALQGDWRAARLMAIQDLEPAAADARIQEWARFTSQGDKAVQVANLLGVEQVRDPGMPPQLALANNPGMEQLVAEAAAQAQPAGEAVPVDATAAPAPQPVPAAATYAAAEPAPAAKPSITRELPPLEAVPAGYAAAEETPPASVSEWAAPAPLSPATQMAQAAIRFVSQPVMQTLPKRLGMTSEPAHRATKPAARPAQSLAAAETLSRKAADGSTLIQLGSFFSEAGARRAWGIYANQFPELSAYRMVITEADVRGKHYYRVNAGGLATADARSLCGRMSAKGQGCIRWTLANPVPGTRAESIRMAAR